MSWGQGREGSGGGGGGGGAPSGPAGGDLSGTYPMPLVAALAITDIKVAAANKDGLANVASMRTLGSGALQACAGTDARLTDARAPTAHATSHVTGGTDVIANAVASGNSGLMSGADKTKLDGITALADPTISTLAAAAGSISVNSQKITNLGQPTTANDAVTKAYVDALLQGFAVKGPVRLATAAALPANVYVNGALGVGATLTASAFGALTVDGTAVAVADRILVKNEAASQNDGIYLVTATGGGAAFYILTRALDMDTAGEFPGAYVLVTEGTANSNRGFSLIADIDVAFTVGTTTQTWSQFTGVGDITQGSGIAITGNTIAVSTTLPDNYTMGAVGTALTVTNNITAGTLTCSSHASVGGVALTLNAAASGINFQLAGVTKADLGTTSATALTLAAGISYSGAAGSGALSFGSMTGDTTLSTGALSYAGASGKTATIGTTAATLTVQTTTSGTIAITSAGAVNITGAAASTLAFSGGAFILQTTSQNLTIQTLTSGTLLIDSVAALNIGTIAATGVTIGRSNQSVAVAGGLLCNSEFRLASTISPASISSNQTDYNPASIAACNTLRQDCSAAVTINSLQGNTANRVILWWNISSTATNTQTFLHDDGATGTAAMRFLCPNNSNFILKGNAGVMLRYDGTSSRWRVLGVLTA